MRKRRDDGVAINTVLWIPNTTERSLEENEVELHRLGGQNPDLKIPKWWTFYYEGKTKPPEHFFVFGAGVEDLASLK